MLPAMETSIAVDRTGFEIACPQRWEKKVHWVFRDFRKVSCTVISQERHSQASKLKRQDSPCLDFALEPLAGLGGGPGGQGRGESPPCSGDWDRSTKDISARGGIMGLGRIYGLVCVYLEYLCRKVRSGKSGAMDAEIWRQQVLQLIYLSRFLDMIE